MPLLTFDEYLGQEHLDPPEELPNYEGGVPRWCKGCGDLGILAVVQRILKEGKIPPEKVVCVSGIGCSSRFPHYLKTYGLHGIHGRALPLSLGVKLARPDLHVLTVMGDGDCFSIGAGHWLHTIRYNVNITVLLFDNRVYALTKKQVSPTTKEGTITNTTPQGAYLKAMNPLNVMLGIGNVSFLAQTTTWLSAHMEATLRRAWAHKGLSFVRILQRCPAYMPWDFGKGGKDFPIVFLEHENGIDVHKGFLKNAPVQKHNHEDILEAQGAAGRESPAPVGLLYCDVDVPTYNDIRYSKVNKVDRENLMELLDRELDRHTIKLG